MKKSLKKNIYLSLFVALFGLGGFYFGLADKKSKIINIKIKNGGSLGYTYRSEDGSLVYKNITQTAALKSNTLLPENSAVKKIEKVSSPSSTASSVKTVEPITKVS